MPLLFATYLLSMLGCSEPADLGAAATSAPPAASSGAAEPPDTLNAAVPPARVAARHILIAYQGAQGAPMGTNRSRKEALQRATELRAQIRGGESMAELAKKYSNDSSRARGGFLGSSEKGAWVPAFEAAAFGLAVGGLSEVVETPFGYHIIQREALLEVRLLHMVMQYQGALNLSGRARSQRRTREAAEAAANEAMEALSSGGDFESVASEYSDGPMGKRGADLGWFTRGEVGPAFDNAVFALGIDETSAVVESPFGFHIVKRIE